MMAGETIPIEPDNTTLRPLVLYGPDTAFFEKMAALVDDPNKMSDHGNVREAVMYWHRLSEDAREKIVDTSEDLLKTYYRSHVDAAYFGTQIKSLVKQNVALTKQMVMFFETVKTRLLHSQSKDLTALICPSENKLSFWTDLFQQVVAQAYNHYQSSLSIRVQDRGQAISTAPQVPKKSKVPHTVQSQSELSTPELSIPDSQLMAVEEMLSYQLTSENVDDRKEKHRLQEAFAGFTDALGKRLDTDFLYQLTHSPGFVRTLVGHYLDTLANADLETHQTVNAFFADKDTIDTVAGSLSRKAEEIRSGKKVPVEQFIKEVVVRLNLPGHNQGLLSQDAPIMGITWQDILLTLQDYLKSLIDAQQS